MKRSRCLLALVGLFVFCVATISNAAEDAAATSSPLPQSSEPSTLKNSGQQQKAALEKLKLDFRSGRSLDGAVEEARKAGVPRQTIAELVLLSCVRSHSLVQLPPLLKEMDEKILPNWRAEDAMAFEEKSQLQGVISLSRALLAAEAGDEGLYEESMKQAFWLNPELSPMLAEEIKRRRAAQSLAFVAVPMDLPFESSSGANMTLASWPGARRPCCWIFGRRGARHV